jgi:hypothetical protein
MKDWLHAFVTAFLLGLRLASVVVPIRLREVSD